MTRVEDGRPLASEFTQSIELMNVQERLFSFLGASFDVCSVCLNVHKRPSGVRLWIFPKRGSIHSSDSALSPLCRDRLLDW